jgi:hypothetical protein
MFEVFGLRVNAPHQCVDCQVLVVCFIDLRVGCRWLGGSVIVSVTHNVTTKHLKLNTFGVHVLEFATYI